MNIKTSYYGPTDTRGSRIKVATAIKAKWYPFDYAARCAHESAVKQFLVDTEFDQLVTTPSIVYGHERGYIWGVSPVTATGQE